jgi:hypothetical protein
MKQCKEEDKVQEEVDKTMQQMGTIPFSDQSSAVLYDGKLLLRTPGSSQRLKVRPGRLLDWPERSKFGSEQGVVR